MNGEEIDIQHEFTLSQGNKTTIHFFYDKGSEIIRIARQADLNHSPDDAKKNFNTTLVGYKMRPTGTYSWIYNVLFESDEFFDAMANGDKKDAVAKNALMKGILFAFEYTGIKFIEKPWLYQELTYKIYRYSGKKIYKPYLSTCLTETNEAFFKRTGLEKDREDVVRDIVFDNGKVRGDIIEEDDGITHEKIRRWFLQNYDLKYLRLFENQLSNKVKGGTAGNNHGWPGCGERAGSTSEIKISLLYVIFPLLYFLSIYLIASYCDNAESSLIQILMGTCIVFYFLIVMKALGFFERQSLLLRMIGCILAGYLAINADETISNVLLLGFDKKFGEHLFKALIRWIILGGFTYFYLSREIRNRIQHTSVSRNSLRKIVRQKATAFFCRAVGYSLILGVFISDFFYDNLLARNIEVFKHQKVFENAGLVNSAASVDKLFPNIPFIFGHVYPDAILMQAPLALFIGIFINLLWEDKALTAPI